VFVDISVGKAQSDNLYVALSGSGFGDRFSPDADNFAEFVQINTILYGAGVKYYPLSSGLGLQLGAEVGLAYQFAVSTMDDFQIDVSPLGFGSGSPFHTISPRS
jgi:hypothetical protein